MAHGNEQVDPVGAKGISRRTVVKGAAWTAPVVAVAVAAPMAAASGDPCEVNDNGTLAQVLHGTWGPQGGLEETGSQYETGFTADGFQSWQNNASLTEDKQFTATFIADVKAGATYALSVPWRVSPGNGDGGAMGSAPQSVAVMIDGSAVGSARMRARDDYQGTTHSGGDHVVAWWESANGTFESEYLATGDGSVEITLTFVLDARGGAAEHGLDAQVNDDIIIGTPELQQIGCSVS